ncbi:MAG: hypothetical protein JKY81_02405 [Colwellia sp.]|nr:hypothetical protein [Colwellia sp.]
MFISLETGKKRTFSILDGIDYIAQMLSFMDSCDTLIFHNGFGYDYSVLRKLHNYEYHGKKEDTLVLSRLLQPKRKAPFHCPNKKAPHSIEAWGYRVGRGKPSFDEWDRFTPEMLHRCVEDVEIGKLTYLALQLEMGDYEWAPAVRLTNKLFDILGQQEQYGWLVDRGQIDRSIKILTHWMDRIDKTIEPYLPIILVVDEKKVKGALSYVKKPFLNSGKYNQHVCTWLEGVGWPCEGKPIGGPHSRISYRKVSLDKAKEVKEWLLDLGWIPDKWNYNDEGERTSPKLDKEDSFAGISSGLGRLVAKRVQCKQRRSIIEGWIGIIRSDGRIPSVVANLAETGRATHRNIVNVPNADSFFGKWMRKIFICKPGYKLVGTDSAGCQLRMLAARMGDAEYMETIVNGDKSNGTDMHTVNQRAAGLSTRAQAKTFIYGFLFGAGDAKIGSIVGGGAAEGKRLKEQFLNGLPSLKALIDKLTKEWRKNAKKRPNKWGGTEYYNGHVIGLDGRPIFIDSEHKILVYVLQSDEAIMMSGAYNILYNRCKKRGWVWGVDWAYVCWYHDEYTAEVREDIAEEFLVMAEQAIVDAGKCFNIACPHEGEGQIGINWYDIH